MSFVGLSDRFTALGTTQSLYFFLPQSFSLFHQLLCRPMVTSRHSSSPAQSSSSGLPPLDALDALLGDISSVSFTPAPVPSSGAGARRTIDTAAPAVPSPSAPLSAQSASSRTGGVLKGFINGKESLLPMTSAKSRTICAGFLGGKNGNKSRFCCKEVPEGFMRFCSKAHSGEKFKIVAKAYYVRMQSDSALCAPFVTQEELVQYDSMHLTRAAHSSKEWIAILDRFHEENGTRGLEEDSPSAVDVVDSTEFEKVSMSDELDKEISESGSVDRKPDVELIDKEIETSSVLRANDFLLPLRDVLLSVDESAMPQIEIVKVLKVLSAHLPSGLTELDDKVSQVKEFLTKELEKIRDAQGDIHTDLFAFSDPAEFITSHHSFAHAIRNLVSDVIATTGRMDELHSSVETASSKADTALMEADSVSTMLSASVTKFATAVRTMSNKTSEGLAMLTSRISSLEMGSPFDGSSRTPFDKTEIFYAAYAHRDTKRVTIGINMGEYQRLTTDNGWILVRTFSTQEEMTEWFGIQGPTVGSLWTDNASFGTGGSDSTVLAGVSSSSPNPGDEPASVVLRGGEIAAQISELTEAIATLKAEKVSFRADIVELQRAAFSRSISVGEFGFDSVSDIVSMLEEDGVDPNTFGIAVDANSYYAHYHDGSSNDVKTSNEMKIMRLAGITDAAALRYVTSFREMHPPYFLNSSNSVVKEGDRFPMLENKTAWHGKSMVTGARQRFEKANMDALKSVEVYIDQHVKSGSKTSRLCKFLATTTSNWNTKLIAHINNELQTVNQYGIPEKETYTLVSNQVNKMYRTMWDQRRLMQEFSTERQGMQYCAQLIWVTLQAHKIMHDFAEPSFETNPLISSIFVRFLAEETGNNSTSGLKGTIDEVKSEAKKSAANLEKRCVAITRRCDALSDTVKRLCTKADVKYSSGAAAQSSE